MKNYIALAAVLLVALVTPGRAQESRPSASVPPPHATLRLQVVLSTYHDDKKLSSLPYTLTIHPDTRNNVGVASLRLGSQVPITQMSRQGGDANAPQVPTVQYKDVGTNIDCTITAIDEGRFRLSLSVEDLAITSGSNSGATANHPAFKSFRTSDSLILRDGQTAQFSTATDKTTGDVLKVDVTLTVVK